MNSTAFPSKTMHMWHPVAPEEISGRWEQFHDCYFPHLPTKYVPREVSLEETISWVFFIEKLPLTGMGCFSEVFWEESIFWILFLRNKDLVICVLPLLSTKWRKSLGGSSWKLLELTSVSRFLAYVTLEHATNSNPGLLLHFAVGKCVTHLVNCCPDPMVISWPLWIVMDLHSCNGMPESEQHLCSQQTVWLEPGHIF